MVVQSIALVNCTLLDELVASPSSTRKTGEQQVRIFVKQLLNALKCMHDKKIAHLDLRPEVILLQDDHLRLADFGRSRPLTKGKVTTDITGSPEFLSPEIASGASATLASDLWSVGTLVYILLSGISPFLGDNDNQTLRKVILGKYLLDCDEFSKVSSEAKDFISRLLILNPKGRLTVDEALMHPWISDDQLSEAKLTSECLREFKYRHKWHERRVFVQQTPSELTLNAAQAPSIYMVNSMAQGDKAGQCYGVQNHTLMNGREKSPYDTNTAPVDSIISVDERNFLLHEASDELMQNNEKVSPSEDAAREQLPLKLVCGERRDIEDEIANRILSDISEENSLIGSADEFDQLIREKNKWRNKIRRSRSRSSTPHVEGYSIETTPIPSPASTFGFDDRDATPVLQFTEADLLQHPAQLDPKVPVGAPLFLEELSKARISPLPSDQLSPKLSLSPVLPGMKSPVHLSPNREYSMEVVITTKRGKISKSEPFNDQLEDIKKVGFAIDGVEHKARELIHDDEFEKFMSRIEQEKEQRRKDLEQLERYKPKNIYMENGVLPERSTCDSYDMPWDSHYQIGPETLLLASRGASFNARVRDYRRELWGDGAPLVTEGYLGFRNQDITVRERRRFTDLVREDKEIAKSVANLDREIRMSQSGALRRIQNNIERTVPILKKEDGTFGAIFKTRLKDVAFAHEISNAIFECTVVANPAASVTWFHHESALTNNGKYKIFHDSGQCKLIILNVSTADLGEYSCIATNELGMDRTSAHIFIGDVPAPPGRPEVELCSDTEVFIIWEAPLVANSLEGLIYKLEMRPAGENDHFSEWRLVSDQLDEEAVIVRYLNPLGIYQFRVTAKNAFGWGYPSLTSRIIRTHAKNSLKLQIDLLKQQYHLCILSKPPKSIISKQKLSGITEEEEDKLQNDESLNILESEQLMLSLNDDPNKRFQIISELCRGRFGLIVNASDSRSEVGPFCIAKLLNSSTGRNPSIEFEILKECQQENVVHLIAAFVKNNIYYFFMEKLSENIFERFLRNDYYNEEQVCRSIMQICSALHWIHFKG